jgi:PKD repeat protein
LIDLGLEVSELVEVESIQWSSNGSGFIQDKGDLTAVYTPATGETGIIEITAVITVRGENYTITGNVEIQVLPDAGFSYSPQTVYSGEMVDFFADTDGFDSYTWIIEGEEYDGSDLSYVFEEAGIYEVTLIVVNGNCTNESIQEIEVLLKNALFVPNVFSPNASNPESRVVKVYGNNIDENGFSFRIFNRWGNELYSTNSFQEANSIGWNGVKEGNSESQKLNSFTYILTGNFTDGTKINKTGTITLVK